MVRSPFLLLCGNRYSRLLSKHWEMENKLHYMLDMLFRTVYSTKRTCSATQGMNIMNRINLTVIQMLKDELKASSTPHSKKKLA